MRWKSGPRDLPPLLSSLPDSPPREASCFWIAAASFGWQGGRGYHRMILEDPSPLLIGLLRSGKRAASLLSCFTLAAFGGATNRPCLSEKASWRDTQRVSARLQSAPTSTMFEAMAAKLTGAFTMGSSGPAPALDQSLDDIIKKNKAASGKKGGQKGQAKTPAKKGSQKGLIPVWN